MGCSTPSTNIFQERGSTRRSSPAATRSACVTRQQRLARPDQQRRAADQLRRDPRADAVLLAVDMVAEVVYFDRRVPLQQDAPVRRAASVKGLHLRLCAARTGGEFERPDAGAP